MIRTGALAAALGLIATPASADIDLARAGVSRLDNGLTVIVLEERALPVVSVQVVYRSGSREEPVGKTGLAHFLEHLAFRGSAAFPDGAATDAIYDAGGEWHGYTWIDQTTYFATVPADRLDLLLAIEADRMAHVAIDQPGVDAEKGAVIAELRGLLNDPSSVLFDAVAATALQVHPYRGNTIGLESTVAGFAVEDAREFYDRHYSPGNAVLSVVGDVSAAEVLQKVEAHFGGLPAQPLAPRVAVIEPPQSGERRVTLRGPVERHHLRIAYPAPAITSPDFPAFLLMQQLLSGGSGVNFRQNDWGTPAQAGSALAGVAEDMASWMIPTADPYLFALSASTDGDPAALEAAIAQRIDTFAPDAQSLAAARAVVREALVFDLETPEDAAHQMAFFAGLNALDTLLGLEDALEAVTPSDVVRVAASYLDPARRTVGWYVPGEASAPLVDAGGAPRQAAPRPAVPAPPAVSKAPLLTQLPGGVPVITREVDLSPTAAVLLVTRGGAPLAGLPEGYGGALVSGLAADLPRLVAGAATGLDGASPDPVPSKDPMTRLAQMMARRSPSQPSAPILAIVTGNIDRAGAIARFEELPGGTTAAPTQPNLSAFLPGGLETVSETIDLPLAQAALGYTVDAPSPATREGVALRLLLYVLTHDYGGRLGDEAIKRRGLVYYIGSDYVGDREAGTIAITMGVDPDKLDPMEALLRDEIRRLASEPPVTAELAAARSHILGRATSAAMDNREIALQLARDFLANGALPDRDALETALAAVSPADIAEAAALLANGTILRVDVAPAPIGDSP